MKHISEYPAMYLSTIINFDDRIYHPNFDWRYAANILEYRGLVETFEKTSHHGKTSLWVRERVRLTKELTLRTLIGDMSHEKNVYYRIFRRVRAAILGCQFSKRAGLRGWIKSLARRGRNKT